MGFDASKKRAARLFGAPKKASAGRSGGLFRRAAADTRPGRSAHSAPAAQTKSIRQWQNGGFVDVPRT